MSTSKLSLGVVAAFCHTGASVTVSPIIVRRASTSSTGMTLSERVGPVRVKQHRPY
jgi:hypothetical protein